MGWGSSWGGNWAGGDDDSSPAPTNPIVRNYQKVKKAVSIAAQFLTGGVRMSVINTRQGRDPNSDVAPVEFNPDNYIRLIKSHGMPVNWSKAMLCPSRLNSPSPGEHDINCDLCDGSGYLYIDPIDTVMTIQGASLEQSFYIQGRFDSGMATVTSLPENKISYWDRIVLSKSSIRYTDLVQRRKGSRVDPLRYAMLDVLHVQSGSKVYTKDKDFKLDEDSIIWTSNKNGRPEDGVDYAIMCVRRPVYLVLNMMNQHRDVQDFSSPGNTREMPLRATVKLDFLVKDEAKEQAAIPAKSPFTK